MTKTKTDTPKAVVLMTAKDLLKDKAAIDKQSDTLSKAGKKLEKQYHILAVSVLAHVAGDGNIHVARNMMEKFPESLQEHQMLRFMEKYGPIRVLSDTEVAPGGTHEGMEAGTLVYDKTRKLQLAAAMENPWWKTMKVAEYRPLDLKAELIKLVEKVDRQKKRGLSAEKGDAIDDEMYAAIVKLVKPAVAIAA